MTLTLAELVDFFGSRGIPCDIDGDASVTVSSVATLEEAHDGQISFLSNPKYEKELDTTKASAVLVKHEVTSGRKMNLLRTADPYRAVTAAIVRLHGYREHPAWGISDRAQIASGTTVGKNANIAPGAYIDENVTVGDNVT